MKFILFFFTIIHYIHATDFVIEPYMGYQLGSYSKESEASKELSGFGLGARIVYFSYGIFGGLDIHHSSLKLLNSSNNDLTQNQIGITGGFAFAIIPIRAWMTYVPSDSLKLETGGTYGGDGVKLGIGFDPIPLLSFNLEFKTSTYDELNDIPADKQLKISSIFLNIGFLFGTNL